MATSRCAPPAAATRWPSNDAHLTFGGSQTADHDEPLAAYRRVVEDGGGFLRGPRIAEPHSKPPGGAVAVAF